MYFDKFDLACVFFRLSRLFLKDPLALEEGIVFGVDGKFIPSFEKRASSSESSYDGGAEDVAVGGKLDGVEGRSNVEFDGSS